jgi:CheY-like chemotaxis protein
VKVLVVDDEFGLREALADVLTDAGHHVATARNGKEALKAIATDQPDLVVMDYMMPVMDGITAVTELRKDKALAQLPVILMSAVSLRKLPASLRVAAVLQKPFDLDTFMRAVDQAT